MSDRVLRINLWVRYINLPCCLFWLSGVAMPYDPRPLFWCSFTALAVNALVHLRTLRTRDARAAAYQLVGLDLATILAGVYFTGGVMSPFLCILPVTVQTVYFVSHDLRRSAAFGFAAFVGFGLVVALWWVQPVRVTPWVPDQYLAWTVFLLSLQLLVLGAAAFASQELPDPLVQALERQEARLAEQRQRAELGTSLAVIAHEIRNPLTTISITLERAAAAARDLPPAARAKLIQQVGSASEELGRIARMLDGVLSYARERRGVSHPAVLSAAEALERAAAFVRLKGGRARRRLRIAVNAPADVTLWADPDAIHQILVNLLDNAVEHPASDRALAIELRATAHGTRTVVEVRDNGCGIPPERQERLFQRFESARPGGTGLGLAICRQLVDDLGGTIVVESAAAEGTSVGLVLPAAPPEPAPVEPTRATGPLEAVLASRSRMET